VAAAVGRKAPAEVQQQQQPEHQQPAAPAHRPPRPRRNILFVGDSLVTGVGCDADSGPTMPRACAEFLSRALRVDVKWTAIGKTGADVAGLKEKLLPAVGSAVKQAQEGGDRIDLVVVVCGLNDFKRAYQGVGRTASSFRATLSEFVAAIHLETGVECTVVLPALPVHLAPVFAGDMPGPYAARLLLANVAALWDEQKVALTRRWEQEDHRLKEALASRLRQAADAIDGGDGQQAMGAVMSAHADACVVSGGASSGGGGGRISFVRNNSPADDAWWSEREYWARDGIHPSNKGYAVWGEHIAQSIVRQALLEAER